MFRRLFRVLCGLACRLWPRPTSRHTKAVPISPPKVTDNRDAESTSNAAVVDSAVEPMTDHLDTERTHEPANDRSHDPAAPNGGGSLLEAPLEPPRRPDSVTPSDLEPSSPVTTAPDQKPKTTDSRSSLPSPNSVEPADTVPDLSEDTDQPAEREHDTDRSDKQDASEKPEVETDQSAVEHRSASHGSTSVASPPRAIGSRRSRRTDASPRRKSDTDVRQNVTPRPELICRKGANARQWEVVLCADDECDGMAVTRDGEPLTFVDRVCCLPSITGSISVDFADGKTVSISLFDCKKPLIFKLNKEWTGDGRRVNGITDGYFIVVTPTAWQRRGSAPVAPDACVHEGFRAHYFVRDKDSEAEIVGGFEESAVELTTSGFELRGTNVFDDASEGVLFVGDVPVLHPASSVVWARVGEEREGGWKGENFRPADRSLADVVQGREGRFFIRVYDENGMLDSGEFRYCAALQEIQVNGASYTATTALVPPRTGHRPTEIRFVGSDEAAFVVHLTSGAAHAAVRPGATVVVEPQPDDDRVSCALESGTGRVVTTVKLPRIWWKIEPLHGKDDSTWRDTLLTMTRHEFRVCADAQTVIRIRMPRCFRSIMLGFDDERDQRYTEQNEDEPHAIPLEDFRDCRQIDQSLNQTATLSVQFGDQSLPLIEVSADPAILSFIGEPTTIQKGQRAMLHWTTRNVGPEGLTIEPGIGAAPTCGYIDVSPADTTTYVLILSGPNVDKVTHAVTVNVVPRIEFENGPVASVVCRNGRQRPGKGFSFGELHAAGMTPADAKLLSIPVDQRRRSTHVTNTDTLRGLTDD